MIDIMPGAEQQQLTESVADFLSNKLPIERLREGGPVVAQEDELWPEILEMGWFEMSLPESLGGSGFSFADEVLMFREFGRYLLSSVVLATRLAVHAAAHAGDAPLQKRLTSGKSRAAVAIPNADASIDAGQISGTFKLIDAQKVDLAAIWNADGFALVARDAFDSVKSLRSLDWASTLELGTLNAVKPLLWLSAKQCELSYQATVLVAAILVGNAEGARDMAVEYAKLREQFGKPIGSFQAVKHHCANMALRAETAYAETLYAGLSMTYQQPVQYYEAHSARILAGDAAVKNAELNIQVHGGIGFTAEADPHLFLKRAHLYNQIGGNMRYHQARLIALDNLSI